ncbi:hypothetical protein HHX47_DHR1002075, partial [Lentinula edodes]
FFVEHYFTLVIFGHFCCVHTGVENLPTNVGVFFALIGNDFQEGSASGTRTSENETHFTGFKYTGRSVSY